MTAMKEYIPNFLKKVFFLEEPSPIQEKLPM